MALEMYMPVLIWYIMHLVIFYIRHIYKIKSDVVYLKKIVNIGINYDKTLKKIFHISYIINKF